MASFIKSISTKNYQNLISGFQVTVKNVKDVFLTHSVHCTFYSEILYKTVKIN